MSAAVSKRTGASMNRHGSKQDYETPWIFIWAVEARFGTLTFDFAARDDNTKAHSWITPELDSLAVPWPDRGIQWLNPPFSKIEPWARKCATAPLSAQSKRLFLVPASVGSNWFARWVHNKALVLALNGPRPSFDGKHPFPKDLMLCVYGEKPGFDVWRVER